MIRKGVLFGCLTGLLWGAVWYLALFMSSCSSARLCAKNWSTTTEISHSVIYGNGVSQNVTVGGDLGDECKAEK